MWPVVMGTVEVNKPVWCSGATSGETGANSDGNCRHHAGLGPQEKGQLWPPNSLACILQFMSYNYQVVDPKKIKMFVLDEADVMIDQQGQQDQTIRIQRYWCLVLG